MDLSKQSNILSISYYSYLSYWLSYYYLDRLHIGLFILLFCLAYLKLLYDYTLALLYIFYYLILSFSFLDLISLFNYSSYYIYFHILIYARYYVIFLYQIIFTVLYICIIYWRLSCKKVYLYYLLYYYLLLFMLLGQLHNSIPVALISYSIIYLINIYYFYKL